jgi:hypothetical protein
MRLVTLAALALASCAGGTQAVHGSSVTPSTLAEADELPSDQADRQRPIEVLDAPPRPGPPGPHGYLSVICVPGCERVSVDGVPIGPSPLFKYAVTPGTHNLTLECPGQSRTVGEVVQADAVAMVRETCGVPMSRAVAAPGPACRLGDDPGGPAYSVRQYLALAPGPAASHQRVRVRGIIHVEFEDTALYDGDAQVHLALSQEQSMQLRSCAHDEVIVTGYAYLWNGPVPHLRVNISPVEAIGGVPGS